MKTLLRSAIVLVLIAHFHPLASFAQNPGVRIRVTPTFVAFGSIAVGKSVTKTLQITNDKTSPMAASVQLGSFSKQAFSIPGTQTAYVLQPGDTARILLQFAPDTTGLAFDSLIVTHDADTALVKNPVVVRVFGTATAPKIADTLPKIVIQQRTIPFGQVPVDTSISRTLLIRNGSDTALTLIGTVSAPALPFVLDSGATFSIDSGKSILVRVHFAPTDSGSFRDSLVVSSNSDSASKRIVIILTGSAFKVDKTLPTVSILIRQLPFGKVVVGASDTMHLSIMNTSPGANTVTGTLAAPKRPFYLLENPTFSIVQNDSFLVHVVFTPDSAKVYSDSVVILTNTNIPTSHVQIRLTGLGAIQTGGVSATVTSAAFASIYPNPASGIVHVAMRGRASGTIKLVDIDGRTVLSNESPRVGSFDLDVHQIPAGVYFLRANIGGTIVSERFEVVR